MCKWTPQFKSNCHMDTKNFDDLFNRLEKRLQPKRLTRPDAIEPKQRLAYTLE